MITGETAPNEGPLFLQTGIIKVPSLDGPYKERSHQKQGDEGGPKDQAAPAFAVKKIDEPGPTRCSQNEDAGEGKPGGQGRGQQQPASPPKPFPGGGGVQVGVGRQKNGHGQ